MTEKTSGNKVNLNDWLEKAEPDIDPVYRRGQVCRGAYIVSKIDNRFYLNNRGEWTNGIRGDENWWDTVEHAQSFLNNLRRSND